MGYESKIYVVKKSDFARKEDGIVLLHYGY